MPGKHSANGVISLVFLLFNIFLVLKQNLTKPESLKSGFKLSVDQVGLELLILLPQLLVSQVCTTRPISF